MGAARSNTPRRKVQARPADRRQQCDQERGFVLPGALDVSTVATPPVAGSMVSASAKQNVLNVSRISQSAAAASSLVGFAEPAR